VSEEKSASQDKSLKRNIFSLGLVSLFTDISSEMVYPLLPDLVKKAGGGSALLGLIEGVAEATANLLRAFSGYLSDRLGKRKQIVFLGYLLGALAKPLLGLSTIWQMILGFRFLDRLGKGIRSSPRDAILADSSAEAERGKWFGFHRSMDTLGAVLGPILAFVLLGLGFKLNHLFFWAFVPAIIALFILQLLVKEIAPKKKSQQKFELNFRGLSRFYHYYLIISGIFALGNFPNVFLILRAKDFEFDTSALPLLYLVYNLVYSLIAIPAGMLSDRWGRKNLLVFALVLFAISYFGFGFAQNPFQIWLLFGLFGIVDGIKEGVQRALIADLVPSEKRASAYGIYYGVIGFLILPASSLAGIFWKKWGAIMVFSYGGGLALLGAFLLLIFLPNQIKSPENRIR